MGVVDDTLARAAPKLDLKLAVAHHKFERRGQLDEKRIVDERSHHIVVRRQTQQKVARLLAVAFEIAGDHHQIVVIGALRGDVERRVELPCCAALENRPAALRFAPRSLRSDASPPCCCDGAVPRRSAHR